MFVILLNPKRIINSIKGIYVGLTEIIKKCAIGVAVITAAATMSCNDSIDPDVRSPYGLSFYTNGFSPDLGKADNKYLDTIDCLNSKLDEKVDAKISCDEITIEIMSDLPYFMCPGSSPTDKCAGLYWPSTRHIQVVESLSALSHEFVEHFTFDGEYTGHNILHKECGDMIDEKYNKTSGQALTISGPTQYKTGVCYVTDKGSKCEYF